MEGGLAAAVDVVDLGLRLDQSLADERVAAPGGYGERRLPALTRVVGAVRRSGWRATRVLLAAQELPAPYVLLGSGRRRQRLMPRPNPLASAGP